MSTVTTLSRVRPQHKLELAVKYSLYIHLKKTKVEAQLQGEQRPKQHQQKLNSLTKENKIKIQ